MNSEKLWKWNYENAVRAIEKDIKLLKKKLGNQIIYNDDLVDPEDMKDPGPAKHVHLAAGEE